MQRESITSLGWKIAYIGGGSRYWAMMLMTDLALTEGLEGEVCLYDIHFEAARYNQELGKAIFQHPDARSRFHVRAVTDPADALKDADFVVLSIEPGPTEMRRVDIEVPRSYGIIQTVADTTGPGGILRALRAIPLKLRYAELVMEHCPQAWVVNYTNPMTLCMSALYSVSRDIRAVGCCHEVFGTQGMLAEKVVDWFGAERPSRQEIQLDVAGVNHFTFASSAMWRGHDLLSRLLEEIRREGFFDDRTDYAKEAEKNELWFESPRLVAHDFLRNFGVLGAAGDRHLVEFVPWYLESEVTLHRWGVVCTPYRHRIATATGPRKTVSEIQSNRLHRSGEESVEILEALAGRRDLVTNLNVPNQGQTDCAPEGHVVETNCLLSKDLVQPIRSKPLPLAVNSLIGRITDEQALVLRSVVEHNPDLAFEALLLDPLNKLSVDRSRSMWAEMIHSLRASSS